MRSIIVFFLVGLTAPAFADTWHCQNRSLEIRCADQQCTRSADFTPWDIHLQTNGNLSVCAYSACWEGRGRVLTSGPHVLISAPKLPRSGTRQDPGSFIVTLNTQDRIGFVQGEGFAMPMQCEP